MVDYQLIAISNSLQTVIFALENFEVPPQYFTVQPIKKAVLKWFDC